MSERTTMGWTMRLAACAVGAVVAALLLFGASARADVSKKHFLEMYKVEMQLDLSGDFPDSAFHEHVFCKSGDLAVDGMWRVDHVDQANAQLDEFGDERDVQIDASYGDDVDPAKWHFRGVNNADGRAQLKLFVTCLGGKTAINGHQHNIHFSPRFDDPHLGLPSGPGAFDHAASCGPDEVLVAPGFNFTAGNGRIFRSWPTATLKGWHWAFLVNGPANVTGYFRCLRIKLNPAGSGPHSHNIQSAWRPGYSGDGRNLSLGITTEVYNCREHEKGLVGGYWIDDPFHVWYLGQDPRIKSRAFRFWWDGVGSNATHVGVLCVNDRVGKQIAP